MRVKDLMQKEVISVGPDLPIRSFEEFLTHEEISGVPVIGATGQILGIASKTDIVRALTEEARSLFSEDLGPQLTVEEIMTRDPVMVEPDDDVRQVAKVMIDGHLHRVLVADDENVVGILTTFDLLRALLPS